MMTTRTPTQRLSCNQIISKIAEIELKEMGNSGEPLTPTLTDLQNFTQPVQDNNDWIVIGRGRYYEVHTPDECKQLFAGIYQNVTIIHEHFKTFIESNEGRTLYSMRTLDPDLPFPIAKKLSKTLVSIPASEREAWLEKVQASIKEKQAEYEAKTREKKESQPKEGKRHNTTDDFINSFYTVLPEHFQPIANHILRTAGEPTEERLQWLHKEWEKASEKNRKLPHPLGIVVKEWQQDQLAKPITKEYDRQYPVAVLKSSLGSIKEVNFLDSDAANLRKFAPPERQEQTDQYLFDFASKTPSILPAVMPLDVAHPLGVKENTRKGAVHHVIRVFFEALMALEPMQTEGNIVITLGDLITYLYPHGKFHRTNQLPYIINALDILHFYATVPYRTESGGTGRWRPVVVRNTIDTNSNDDDGIYMDVKLPPDATQGMMVEKQIMRRLGHESAPRFNAYLMGCWLWDKYGTGKKGLIDPTKPVETRDAAGNLLLENGEKIFDSRGKPIQNLYHEDAITQLTRERNPAADRYPIVTFDDLILACKPSGYDPKRQKRELDRALKHWEQLATEGVIQIEKHSGGWRIMPGKSHIARYRGLRKAATKTR